MILEIKLKKKKSDLNTLLVYNIVYTRIYTRTQGAYYLWNHASTYEIRYSFLSIHAVYYMYIHITVYPVWDCHGI